MGSVVTYCSNSSNVVIPKDKDYTIAIISDISSTQNYSNKTNNILLNSSYTNKENDEKKDKSYISVRKHLGHSNSESKLPYNPFPFVKIVPKKLSY